MLAARSEWERCVALLAHPARRASQKPRFRLDQSPQVAPAQPAIAALGFVKGDKGGGDPQCGVHLSPLDLHSGSTTPPVGLCGIPGRTSKVPDNEATDEEEDVPAVEDDKEGA